MPTRYDGDVEQIKRAGELARELGLHEGKISEEIPAWSETLFPDQPLKFVRRPRAYISPWCYDEIGRAKGRALHVICTARVFGDGRRWMHVSCSKPLELPSWDDLKLVKDTFIGRDRTALQVLPRAAEYVNIHPYVLHLYACLDGDVTPDFRVEGTI